MAPIDAFNDRLPAEDRGVLAGGLAALSPSLLIDRCLSSGLVFPPVPLFRGRVLPRSLAFSRHRPGGGPHNAKACPSGARRMGFAPAEDGTAVGIATLATRWRGRCARDGRWSRCRSARLCTPRALVHLPGAGAGPWEYAQRFPIACRGLRNSPVPGCGTRGLVGGEAWVCSIGSGSTSASCSVPS